MSREGLSRLSEKCRACPFVAKCGHKQMEAMAYLPEPQMAKDAAQPLLRETMTIFREGNPITVYKDEIEKQLYEQLYSHLGLQYGG